MHNKSKTFQLDWFCSKKTYISLLMHSNLLKNKGEKAAIMFLDIEIAFENVS